MSISAQINFCQGWLLLFALSLLFVACAPKEGGVQCTVDADCGAAASRWCHNGQCVKTEQRKRGSVLPLSYRMKGRFAVRPDLVNELRTQAILAVDETMNDTSQSRDFSEVLCTSHNECDDHNPCTSDYCNASVSPAHCDTMPKAEGSLCQKGDPCYGRSTCRQGRCVAQTPPCGSEVMETQCARYEPSCDAVNDFMCSYTMTSIRENEPCYQGDPCQQGVCQRGECVGADNPCVGLGNACTAYSCKRTGDAIDDYSCLPISAPDGQECLLKSTETPCHVGSESPDFIKGYCVSNGDGSECIVGPNRKCYDSSHPNICTAHVCRMSDGSCEPLMPLDVSVHVACGETVVLEAADFITRDYYHYGDGPCAAFDVRGREVALTVALSAPAAVDIEVRDEGGQDISLHHLANMCDPQSCISNAYDELQIPYMTPSDAVLVEAGIGNPPARIEIAVRCRKTSI